MRVGFFFREALRALRRNGTPSLAAILTVVLTALVLGVFIPVVQATTGAANEVRGRVLVDVYVSATATPAEVAALGRTLKSSPNVRSVDFISKDEALARERERSPQAFELLGTNPLPDAFRVSPEDPGRVTAIVDAIAPRGADGRRHPRLAAVDEVRNREEDTQKILSATTFVKGLVAGLAVLLVLASVALVANTIRLSIFSRRREIEVMRLVGATNWFIRWPFVIEGVLVGLTGGVLAIGLLLLAKETFVDPLSDRFAFVAAPETLPFGTLAAILVLACVAVSAAGSGLTLRRFLRI